MKTNKIFSIATCAFLLGACHSVKVEAPSVKNTPQPKATLQGKKASLQNKKKAATQLPEVLGGIVKSDEWVIYKDKEQEEFIGHVSYDNGVYAFRAGHGLSDRRVQTFTAKQNVYLKQQQPQGPTYEAWADYARYNYQTGKGILKSASATPVRLSMTDISQTITARAKQISFDTQAQVFILTGNVYATRTTEQGTQIMQADKVTFKQQENYLRLDGNALVSDTLRNLQADTIIYDGNLNEAHAYGKRTLATGTTEQGTFAIIADNLRSDAQGNVIKLDGQIQGWVVSPTLNENKINSQF